MPTEGLLSNLMMLAGLSLVVAILMRRLSRRRRRNSKASAQQRQAERTYSQPLIDAPPEVARWQVEMHEVARELRAELDSKAVVAQTLLTMLREEADRLDAVLAKLEAAGATSAPPAGDANLLAEIRRLTGEIAANGPAADGHLAQEQARQLHAPVSDAAQRRIYSLTDQGYRTEEIARQLSLAEGEVEWALGLRRD